MDKLARQKPRVSAFVVCASLVLALILTNCRQTSNLKRTLTPPDKYHTLDEEAPFLKAHMYGGNVYILSDWSVNDTLRTVYGTGHLLDVNRDTLDHGAMELPLDEVAIFETNVLEPSEAVAALAIMTGISLAAAGLCLANQKACFGSCPTFYAEGDTLLHAEGFSSSIAPSLEARDVDALYRLRPQKPILRLTMTNEALETHVVRRANVMYAERPAGGRVLAGIGGQFWPAVNFRAPDTCRAPDGGCAEEIRDVDGRERFSLADSTDLAAKEYIELSFDVDSTTTSIGLVVSARQTLLSTFVLYQMLAYMGTDVGEWMAILQRMGNNQRRRRLASVLGGIDVEVQNTRRQWIHAGTIDEHGPLASDVHVIPLPADVAAGPSPVRIRLHVTKGAWRIDYLALADLLPAVAPSRLLPYKATSRGNYDRQALASLLDSNKTLTTMPGDAYTLSYRLPDDPDQYELFLETEGYYLEWMRQEWLEETNRERVTDFLSSPKEMMKTLAPVYKKLEPTMEQTFWNSRYAN